MHFKFQPFKFTPCCSDVMHDVCLCFMLCDEYNFIPVVDGVKLILDEMNTAMANEMTKIAKCTMHKSLQKVP